MNLCLNAFVGNFYISWPWDGLELTDMALTSPGSLSLSLSLWSFNRSSEAVWLRKVKEFSPGPTAGKFGAPIWTQVYPTACVSQTISFQTLGPSAFRQKTLFLVTWELRSHCPVFSYVRCEANISMHTDLLALPHSPCLVSFLSLKKQINQKYMWNLSCSDCARHRFYARLLTLGRANSSNLIDLGYNHPAVLEPNS